MLLCLLPRLEGRGIDKLALQSPGGTSDPGTRHLLSPFRNLIGQFGHAAAIGRNRAHDNRSPARTIGGRAAQGCFGRCGRWQVGLVDDQNIGNLEDPCLGGLHVITGTRRPDDHADIGQIGHLNFGLPDTDGFNNHNVPSGCIHDIDHSTGGPRQATQMPA